MDIECPLVAICAGLYFYRYKVGVKRDGKNGGVAKDNSIRPFFIRNKEVKLINYYSKKCWAVFVHY